MSEIVDDVEIFVILAVVACGSALRCTRCLAVHGERRVRKVLVSLGMCLGFVGY